jgi:signal transduction histidine kinase
LRWQISVLAGVVVAVAAAVMALAAYLVVSEGLNQRVDDNLRSRALTVTTWVKQGVAIRDQASLEMVAQTIRYGDNGIYFGLVLTNGLTVRTGPIPLGPDERAVVDGTRESSLSTVDDHRVLAQRLTDGITLILAKDLTSTHDVLTRLAWVFAIIGGSGAILAAVAGTTVAEAGLRPVDRLIRASERVARTDDLRPIPVSGNDELAGLASTFNTMLAALSDSRDRQSQLIGDAGHKLRTPLTSLRTNLELLIAASKPGASAMSEEDMAELRSDVIAQIEEFSGLVADLVDVAREPHHW